MCLRELHSLKLGQEGGILFWRQLTNAHLNFSLRWRQGLRLKPLTAYNGDEICLLSLQPTPPPLEFFHLIFKFPWLSPQRGSKDVSKSCTEIIQGIVLSSSTYSTTNMIYRWKRSFCEEIPKALKILPSTNKEIKIKWRNNFNQFIWLFIVCYTSYWPRNKILLALNTLMQRLQKCAMVSFHYQTDRIENHQENIPLGNFSKSLAEQRWSPCM